MAGLGYRVFQAGEVLTAANVMGYLQDQVVQVYAGTAARSSAIGTALSEGMVTYLSDTNAVEVWDGAAWQNINDNTNSVLLSNFTASGDLIAGAGAGSIVTLARGTTQALLYVNGTALAWLPPGSDGQYLNLSGGSLQWAPVSAPTKTIAVFTTSTTWVVPAGVNYVNLYVASGGGGGGSGAVQTGANQASARNATGGGGGGGAPVLAAFDFTVTPGSTATITIGAGGAGGTAITNLAAGSAVGVNGSPGGISSFIIDGDSFETVSQNDQDGTGGNTSATSASGGSIFGTTSTTGINADIRDNTPSFMNPGDGSDARAGNDSDAASSPNTRRKFLNRTKLSGSSGVAATGATLAGTAGGTGDAGFIGGGGGGGMARYSTASSAVFGGGAGVAGGGGGGAAAYGIAGTSPIAGAGGNGAANSGAGGGGGGGCGAVNSTAVSGAGGNGGSGFIVLTY